MLYEISFNAMEKYNCGTKSNKICSLRAPGIRFRSARITYLCSLGNVLHPTKFLGMSGRGDQNGLFSVIKVETMFLSEARLAVKNSDIFEQHLTVNAEMEARSRCTVGINEQVRKLEE